MQSTIEAGLYAAFVAPPTQRSNGDSGRFEIGREAAEASKADAEHRARFPDLDHSPLAAIGYDLWAWEHDLVRFVESPVDAEVSNVVADFRTADSARRSYLRNLLTPKDFYTLISFARRSAVAAIRGADASLARDGLNAVAIVDVERVDWRDVLVATGLIAHVLHDLGDMSAISGVLPLAEAPVAALIARFEDPSEDDADPASWGFRKVRTRHGAGFADTGIEPYAPARDLLEGDDYRARSFRLGERLPSVWLPGTDRQEANRAVDGCTGCVVTNTTLSASAVATADSQQLTVFVVEAPGPQQAADLEGWSTGGSHASLAYRDDAVVCLLIARSFVEGVAPYESDASLQRFAGRLSPRLCPLTPRPVRPR